jgi:salicylate hydroxylase
MLPFMAQGAVQGIEDAFVLAKCLEGADRSAVPNALGRYETIRKPRAARVQERARQNGQAFHLRDGKAQRERDAHFAASAGTNPLLASAWLYGHDAEEEFMR